MATKVLVAGAIGTQVGSVVEHLLSGESGEYDVYGLTRTADSDAATTLESHGVTVLQGELTDEKRMRECCEGTDAVFGVTRSSRREPTSRRNRESRSPRPRTTPA